MIPWASYIGYFYWQFVPPAHTLGNKANIPATSGPIIPTPRYSVTVTRGQYQAGQDNSFEVLQSPQSAAKCRDEWADERVVGDWLRKHIVTVTRGNIHITKKTKREV